MPRKSFTPEQVIAKLRHIEVALANGRTLPLEKAMLKELVSPNW
jgi:hypothetical protein